MDWSILGIAPTSDKNQISAAYRERLKQTNPEDRPEEFKALRAAYEEALRLAEQGEAPQEKDETPVGLWMEKVSELYADFARRIRDEEWKALFSDEVLVALDMRPQAEDALFRFLQLHWFLPQSVWKLIVDEFSVRERRDEFYALYSKDFIDYAVLSGADNPPSLSYELFIPGRNGADCDRYRQLYREASNAGDIMALNTVLDEMESLSETHPYGQAMRWRSLIDSDRDQEARLHCRELADSYPDDDVLAILWANLCVESGDPAEAERRARHILELNPGNQSAAIALADALFLSGRHSEAKDMIYDLMDTVSAAHPTQNRLLKKLQTWNESIITELESKAELSVSERMELAWAYLQNDRTDDAVRLCETVSETEVKDPYDYHNLLAKCYASADLSEKAYEHLHFLTGYIPTLDPAIDPKAEKRQKIKLPDLLQMEAGCLRSMGRTEEARALLEKAAEQNPDDVGLLLSKGNTLYWKNEFGASLECLDRALAQMPDSPSCLYLRSRSLLELRRDREAFEDIESCLEIDPSRLEYYTLKLDILIRNQAWEPAHELMDFLKQNGLDSICVYAYYEAVLVEEEQKDEAKALELYTEIERRVDAGESIEHPEDLYYRLAYLSGRDRDPKKQEDFEYLMAYADKCLTQNGEHIPALYYKAWLLKSNGSIDSALEIYHRLEAYPHHTVSVERALADAYYSNLSRNADKALHYYEKLEKLTPDDDVVYFYLGCCHRTLGNYEEAEKAFRREIELAPDDLDGYRGLSIVREYENRNAEALEFLDKVIALSDDDKKKADYLYRRHKLQRRMGRPSEAIDTLEELAKASYGYYIFRLKFDTLAGAGMWDEAKELLKQWKKSGEDKPGYADCEIKLAKFTGNLLKVRFLIENSAQLTPENKEAHKLDMAGYDGKYKSQLKIWENRLSKNPESDYVLNNLARCCYLMGDTEKCREYAQRALDRIDEILPDNNSNEPLYITRRALSLALLGREAEARSELERARGIHLCEMCFTGHCKDADVFEAEIEEIFGNRERALELAQAGLERCPDEFDFTIIIHRLSER